MSQSDSLSRGRGSNEHPSTLPNDPQRFSTRRWHACVHGLTGRHIRRDPMRWAGVTSWLRKYRYIAFLISTKSRRKLDVKNHSSNAGRSSKDQCRPKSGVSTRRRLRRVQYREAEQPPRRNTFHTKSHQTKPPCYIRN